MNRLLTKPAYYSYWHGFTSVFDLSGERSKLVHHYRRWWGEVDELLRQDRSDEDMWKEYMGSYYFPLIEPSNTNRFFDLSPIDDWTQIGSDFCNTIVRMEQEDPTFHDLTNKVLTQCLVYYQNSIPNCQTERDPE